MVTEPGERMNDTQSSGTDHDGGSEMTLRAQSSRRHLRKGRGSSLERNPTTTWDHRDGLCETIADGFARRKPI